jgi:hypothetical protein
MVHVREDIDTEQREMERAAAQDAKFKKQSDVRAAIYEQAGAKEPAEVESGTRAEAQAERLVDAASAARFALDSGLRADAAGEFMAASKASLEASKGTRQGAVLSPLLFILLKNLLLVRGEMGGVSYIDDFE